MGNSRKNKDFNPHNCPVTHCLSRIGGQWKVLILYGISKNCNRFSKLQRAIPSVSKQMLVNQLRELEDDGIIERTIYPEIPPRVEYKLSDYGRSLIPVINVMQEWGLNDLKAQASDRVFMQPE
ncbi:helix-turn-helix domain-containing protein [Spirosoma sp. SC4-14]|uniref:winged helix-turn-helix transcriptional regulator n=1 Tax=Spirosoma sp. SC4-14 TaxID=3128900 RepID=UPI0030D3CEE3